MVEAQARLNQGEKMMSTSVIEREPGGAKRRSTLKGTARKVAMVGAGVSMLGSGMVVVSTSASAVEVDPSIAAPQLSPQDQSENQQKISICHRTSSWQNPYELKDASTESILRGGDDKDNGHAGHTGGVFNPELGSHQESWGDIIPSFVEKSSGTSFGGLNVGSLSVIENGCKLPNPATFTICHALERGYKEEDDLTAVEILEHHASSVYQNFSSSTNHLNDIIPAITGLTTGRNLDVPRNVYLLDHNCNGEGYDNAAKTKVTICTVQGTPPYVQTKDVKLSDLVDSFGSAIGAANTVNGVYGSSVAYGNIVPLIPANAYLARDFAGANWPTGKAIYDLACVTTGIPPYVPPVVPPVTNTVTNTVTVPGPTVTVTATPTPTASAVPPVAIAPVVTPSATPSRVPPVAVAPVTAAVPTAVDAGDGSSQNRPMSPGSIVLLALAGVGVLYAALRLSTRRPAGSSQ